MTLSPKPQWDCIRQNLGDWQGSFTELTPDGEPIKDTPSRLTLEEDVSGQHMTLTLTRTPTGTPPDTMVRDFSFPGPAPYVYFFETGAFAQGSMQWRAFSQFGAEFAFTTANRRLRLVNMYEGQADGTSALKYITLIREKRSGGLAPERAPLQLSDVLGTWVGEATVMSPSTDTLTMQESRWQLSPTGNAPMDNIKMDSLLQFSSTIKDTLSQSFHSTVMGQRVVAEAPSWQMCLLPDGAAVSLPRMIQPSMPVVIESSWLIAPNHRQRLIRQYDDNGTWSHLIFVEDHRVAGAR